MKTKKMAPVHPGEILLEQFLKPMGMSQNRLAIEISVPPRRINEIVKGKRREGGQTLIIDKKLTLIKDVVNYSIWPDHYA